MQRSVIFQWISLLVVVLLVAKEGDAFSSVAPWASQAPTTTRTTTTTTTTTTTRPTSQYSTTRRAAAAAKKKDDDDEDPGPGMNDAFRQLESLSSLGDDDDDETTSPSNKPPISAKPVPDTVKQTPLTTEKEAQMYTNMMKDLESTDEVSLYKDVMSDMGGDAVVSPASSRSNTPKRKSSTKTNATPVVPSQKDMEEFMESALAEALDEVKLKAPGTLSAESILNDKEIMKEIEAIFDQGSAQLMENLEDMRKEQQSFAKVSAESSAREAADAVSAESKRLARAEASMSVMLDRVSKEAVKVEQAAQDLRDAQAEMDKNFIVKLRNGGIPKQAALVGFLLFSFRSIGDTLAAFNDESLLAGALVQGGIAVVCAIIFFFL